MVAREVVPVDGLPRDPSAIGRTSYDITLVRNVAGTATSPAITTRDNDPDANMTDLRGFVSG